MHIIELECLYLPIESSFPNEIVFLLSKCRAGSDNRVTLAHYHAASACFVLTTYLHVTICCCMCTN